MTAINVNVPTLCVHSPLDSTAKLNYTYRNKLINGGFDVWQRGAVFLLASPAYTADRWYVDLIGTVTRSSFLPGESELMDNAWYFLMTTPSGSGAALIEQRIENVRTLAGKQTTLTFWAKSGISGSTMPVSLVQNFGTSGSADVVTVVGTATLTTAWVKHTMTITLPSIAGKTVGASGNDYVSLKFTLPVDSISICNVQWEQGPLATDFELRPYDEELRLCRRFYEQQDLLANQLALTGVTTGNMTVAFLLTYAEKRAVPTIIMPTEFRIYPNVDTPTWATYGTTKTTGNMMATGTTALTFPVVMVGQASADCSITISAEL